MLFCCDFLKGSSRDDREKEMNMVAKLEKNRGPTIPEGKELSLPWSKFTNQDLRHYIPVSWQLPKIMVDVLRREGGELNKQLPYNTNPNSERLINLELLNGGKFLGEAVEDNFALRMQGSVLYLDAGGSLYLGETKDGYLHGFGLQISSSGDWFRGQFDHNEKITGVEYLRHLEQKFEGDYNRGLPEGQGTLIFNDGRTYKGEFFEGHRSGFGKFTWPNGNYYEGEWAKDKQHGLGKLFVAEKKQIFCTEWREGELLS